MVKGILENPLLSVDNMDYFLFKKSYEITELRKLKLLEISVRLYGQRSMQIHIFAIALKCKLTKTSTTLSLVIELPETTSSLPLYF